MRTPRNERPWGDTSGEASGERSGEGRWITYDELGRIRGIGRESAVKLAQRKRWRRIRGNDGEARINVPLDWLVSTKDSPSPQASPDTSPDIGRLIAAFEATTAALTVRAERAEAEADPAIAATQVERSRAETAEAALTAEQAARAATTARAEIAETVLASAEAEAATLRQAEQERRARSLVGRIRAALRGE
jgi:hypothetical protein